MEKAWQNIKVNFVLFVKLENGRRELNIPILTNWLQLYKFSFISLDKEISPIEKKSRYILNKKGD